MIVLCLLLLVVPLPIKLKWDYDLWKKHGKNPHPFRLVVIVTVMGLVSYIVWRIGPVRYLAQPLLLSTAIFGMFFDYIINWIEGRDWYFISEPGDKYGSWIDMHIYYPLGWWKLLILKVCFLALALTFNHWIWH